MRTWLTGILLLVFLSLPAQDWESLNRRFNRFHERQEYGKALEMAREELEQAQAGMDSSDVRFMHSHYNVALACYGLRDHYGAREHIRAASRLMVPYFTYDAGHAEVCELYGRIETALGSFAYADTFLSRARDIKLELFGERSPEYVRSLYYQYELERAREEPEEMTRVLEHALDIREKYLGVDQEYAMYANDLGLFHMNGEDNRKAARNFRRAIMAYDTAGMPRDFHFANACNNLAMLRYYEQKYGEAAYLFERADTVYRDLSRSYSPNHMLLLTNIASLYYEWGQEERTLNAYEQLVAYLERYPEEKGLNYIRAAESAADYFAGEGEARRAGSLYLKAIALRAVAEPYDFEEHAGCILLLAYLYAEEGRPDLAAETALGTWDIFRKELPEGHEHLVFTLSFLGMNYYNAEMYNTSLYYYEEARRQLELGKGPRSAEAPSIYNNLGALYYMQNRFREAIVCMERSLELQPGDPVILTNMGLFSYELGNPRQARDYFQKALQTYADHYGKREAIYAEALISFVEARIAAGDFSEDMIHEIREAENIYLAAGEDTTSVRFIDCIREYRVCYFLMNDYERALACGTRAMRLAEQGEGRASLYYATTSLEQAGLYVRLNDREALEALYEDLLSIANELEESGRERLLHEVELSRYSNWYHLEEYEQARKSLEWVVESDRRNFLDMQGILSAGERATFASTLTSLIDYNSFVMRFPDDPEVLSRAMNYRLFLKGLLFRSERGQRELLESSGDSLLTGLYGQYTENRKMLANIRSQFGVELEFMESVEEENHRLEREMARRLGELEINMEWTHTWEDIRDALGENEVAVEMVNFYYLTAEGPQVYLEPWYLAFIITPEMEESPLCLPLYTSPDVYASYLGYRRDVETGGSTLLEGQLYDLLWSSVDSIIGERETLYFSPDLIFHQINIEAFRDAEGTLLLDKYRIRYLSTLAELLEPERDFGDNRKALLAGDPRFRMSRSAIGGSAEGPASEDEANRGVSEFQARMFPGARLSPLPGTRAEVDSISSMLEAGGWDCRTFTGPEATEEAVTSVSNPRILHLATHGFFAANEVPLRDTLGVNDDLRSYNYMDSEGDARSCLFFAGAQNTLFHAYDYQKGRGDGILTAWEIEDMDLDSTELVVLSACETGLGDMLNAEGVSGIRRAFHLAGAGRLMLSLWEVDDNATRILMQEFYSNWLNGMNMDDALAEAKRYLIRETPYDHPRYWSAFILTGF